HPSPILVERRRNSAIESACNGATSPSRALPLGIQKEKNTDRPSTASKDQTTPIAVPSTRVKGQTAWRSRQESAAALSCWRSPYPQHNRKIPSTQHTWRSSVASHT